MYKKTVIAEIKKNYAIVIDEGGEMHRIKLKKGMRVGDRIYYMDEDRYRLVDQKKVRRLPRWAAGAIAAAAVFFIIAYQLLASSGIPVAQAAISIGAEEGIQVEVNEDQQIQRVLDQNGNELDMPELTGKTLNEAYTYLVSFVEGLGVQDILISVAAETGELSNQIKQQLLTRLQENQAQKNIIFLAGNMEDFIEALEQNTSLAALGLTKNNIQMWTPEEGQGMTQEEKQSQLGEAAEFYQVGEDEEALRRQQEDDSDYDDDDLDDDDLDDDTDDDDEDDDIEVEVIVPDEDDDDDFDDDDDDDDNDDDNDD